MSALDDPSLNESERIWLSAYADDQVAPYRSLLTKKGADVLRDNLIDALLARGDTREIIRRLAPPVIVDSSGTNKIDRASLEEAEAAREANVAGAANGAKRKT